MVKIIGHRGAAGIVVENSLVGFRHAVFLGLDGVEFDIHQTADERLVVVHDPDLSRTTTGMGAVCDLTLGALRTFALKEGTGEPVPLLEEVLTIFAGQDMELQIELKTDILGRAYLGMADRVVSVLSDQGLLQQARLTSFVPGVLETVRRRWPDLPLLASINRASAQQHGGLEAAVRRCHDIGNCMVAVHTDLMLYYGASLIEMFGRDVLGVWAPKTQAELSHWMASGLRQVTTDRPDLASLFRNAS